ncbi:MAG: hypothetical protein IT381_30090 [Deltaproteobacteria bacterium]|nr:hypothetical protein [Deltaproteobacteria bacterium]
MRVRFGQDARMRFGVIFLCVLVGCGEPEPEPGPAPAPVSETPAPGPQQMPPEETVEPAPSPAPDPPKPVDKAAACASTFGKALTAPFGRLDGIIVAVLKPSDQQCTRPNSDHVIVQVRAQAAVYRMVVNVESDRGDDRRVRFAEVAKALAAPAWSEGWHQGAAFDYVKTLAVHSTDAIFQPLAMTPLIEAVLAPLEVGAKISVYATTSGGDSAHKVHRNASDRDGAIVVDPTGTPKYLLFHFVEQSF